MNNEADGADGTRKLWRTKKSHESGHKNGLINKTCYLEPSLVF